MTGLAAFPLMLFLTPVELAIAWYAWHHLREDQPVAAALMGMPAVGAGVLSVITIAMGMVAAVLAFGAISEEAAMVFVSLAFVSSFLAPFAHAGSIAGAGAALALLAWEIRDTPLDDRQRDEELA